MSFWLLRLAGELARAKRVTEGVNALYFSPKAYTIACVQCKREKETKFSFSLLNLSSFLSVGYAFFAEKCYPPFPICRDTIA